MYGFQIFMMAFRGLRANLLRSLLATLGVIIGVGAVISAMSILEGTQRDIVQRFESLGSETIMVTPAMAKTGGRAVGIFQTLTVEDADALGDPRNCPNIKAAAPEISGGASVKNLSRNNEYTILGTSNAYADMFNYRVAQGRFLTREDVASEQKVAVLGYKVADELFGNIPPVNRTIKVRSVPFRVVGVMEEKGNIGFRNVDSQVIVPVTTAMNRLFGSRFIHGVSVQAAGGDKVEAATSEIKRELRRRHNINIRAGKRDDFQVFSQEEQRKQLGEVTTIFSIVLYSIAGISLVVGGIGIANIMLVSVTERTREIGVRMAVGAQRWDILSQFLIEAGVISLLGGAFGVGVGFMMTDLLQKTTRLIETYTAPRVIVYALVMAILTGIFSGIYPAFKASRLDPVEALRYE
ncbi:MAG TPA: ABC transporter permease [Phycisphaerae bacterium]|nr:ABC transporter permease [Phycisphaerae bacterium]